MARITYTTLTLLTLAALSVGCSPTPSSEQSDLLVPDSIMQEIFIEFHLMEARSDLLNQDVIHFRDSVFKQYDVDSLAYENTMQYYSDNPEVYMEVYSSALDRLSDERYQ